MLQKISGYFYDSWIRTTGKGWTGRQVLVSYIFSVVFALSVVFYSIWAGLHWSAVQVLTATLIAWDLGGGVLGYNHRAMKIRQAGEIGKLHFFHHNLLHIHPLMLIFFYSEPVLLALAAYWFVTFVLYVEFLEINPETGRRKIRGDGEKVIIAFELAVTAGLVLLAYYDPEVFPSDRLYGFVVYGAMLLLTLILVNVPVPFQRTASVMFVAAMTVAGMFVSVPKGFAWLIPVYFLKLLTGYTARDEVRKR